MENQESINLSSIRRSKLIWIPFHLDFYTSSTQAKDRAWLQMAKIFQNDAVAAGRISTSKMNAHECSPRSRSNQVGSVEEGLLLFLHGKGPNRQTPPHTRSKQSETICGERICVQGFIARPACYFISTCSSRVNIHPIYPIPINPSVSCLINTHLQTQAQHQVSYKNG